MTTEPQTEAASDVRQRTPVRTLPSLAVEIDLTKLELGDIILLDDIASGNVYDIVAAARMLDRVLVGGVAGRPINQYRALLGRMLVIIQEIVNPKSEG